MLELLIHLLPTIFVSCAVLIVLLNIKAFLTYFIYIFSMAFQPKQLLQTSMQVEQREFKSSNNHFFLAIPFIRLWTLTKVLFFPDLDISGIIQREKDSPKNDLANIYTEKTQEEMANIRIKSYSVAGVKDTSHFRSAMEPVEPITQAPSVSPELAMTFPSLTKNIQSIFGNTKEEQGKTSEIKPEVKFQIKRSY